MDNILLDNLWVILMNIKVQNLLFLDFLSRLEEFQMEILPLFYLFFILFFYIIILFIFI